MQVSTHSKQRLNVAQAKKNAIYLVINKLASYSSPKISLIDRMSLRRYNVKFVVLLDLFASLSGEQCSIEYRFRENEVIFSEENL